MITDNNKLFWPQAVETDEFPASFHKSMGLTPRLRQFPKGYVFPLALNRQEGGTQNSRPAREECLIHCNP